MTTFRTTTITTPPFFPPPSGKYLESLPKNEPPFRSRILIPIPPALPAPPLATDDFYLLGPTSQTQSNNLYGSQAQALSREQEKKKTFKKNLMIKYMNFLMILQNLS